MLSKIKPVTEPVVEKIAKPLAFLNPNHITIIGLVFPVGFVYSMYIGNYILAMIFIILSIFDTLDGVIARSTGKVTKFGGLLDSSLDRIADGLYISAFGFAGISEWWLVTFLLISSYMISYIRSRAELAGKGEFKLDVGWIERPERMIFLLISVITLYLELSVLANYILVLLFLLSIITVFQRFTAAKQRLS